MILVTGATGHLGKKTIDFLIKKGVAAGSIAALVRDENKAADLKDKGVLLKKADYNDYASLISAFAGVDKLLFVSSSDVANRMAQHTNVVKAAREAGVKHIIYTSFIRKNETASSPIAFVAASHIETEKWIKESGIPYTFMLNSFYSEGLPMFFGEKVLETGIFLPCGDGKASFTTRDDMAEATAAVLATSGHENKSYIIAGPTNYTLADAAKALSELTGKNVAYAKPSTALYKETLVKAGVPDLYIGLFAGFSEAIAQGEFEVTATDLEKLLGHKATSLKEYLSTVYK